MAESTYLDEPGEMKSLGEYLSLLNRRKFHFIIPFVLLSALATAIVMSLPPIYRSEATILVESQQIPDELVRSTITSYAAERIEFIKQKVLTRANVLDIVKKYELYAKELGSATSADLVTRFRDSIEITLVSADVGRGQRSTIAFGLAFETEDPNKAKMVASELVTLFLNENVRTRSERAAETTEFLAGEGERIRADMQQMETRVAEFKLANSEMLPEVLEMNLNLMDRLESDYQSVSLKIESLESELKMLSLEREQFLADQNAGTSNQSLYELRRQYRELSQTYSENHPDIMRLKRKLADAELMSDEDIDQESLVSNPAYRTLHMQIDSTTNQLELLTNSQASLRQRLQDVERRIAQSPNVEKQYIELQRDLENLTAKYQDLKNKELEARISQNLEEERKGERFALLEPPEVPQEPSKPNRPKFLVFGLFFAAAAGAGMVILAELLNPVLRGRSDFTRVLGTTPLVYIPFVTTQTDIDDRKRKMLISAIGTIAAIMIVAISVHFFWSSLDEIWLAALRRISTF